MLTEPQTTVSTPVADAPVAPTEPTAPAALKDGQPTGEKPQILEEVIIEEVSIDGMCGVY